MAGPDETLYEQLEQRESASEMVVASFAGTLAFGRLALLCVFIACLVGLLMSGSFTARVSVVLAIAAIAFAYASQSYGTDGDEDQGVQFQIGSVVTAAIAVLMFLFGG